MKLVNILLLLSFLANINTQAQSPFCGFDDLRQKLYSADPESANREREMNERVARAILNKESLKTSGGTIIIPVVFHIMHNNGPENIHDSVVVNAVNELNLRLQNAAPYYDTTGNAVDIQFCLATVDPAGNPTIGITRTVTTYTNLSLGDDDELKGLVRWSPLLYCNVWVVNNINGGVAGYAAYPNNAGTAVDGIVLEAMYMNNSYVLIHEVGHYSGLAHTFSYSCLNYNCLLDGDQVCDTPPDTTQLGSPCMWNSCSSDTQDTTGLSPFTTDVNELPNYMDYTSCALSLTQGQGERMVTLVSLFRSLLANSNACGANPGQPLPVADFDFSVSNCNNGEVSFSDSVSINTLTSEWDFDNDGQYETFGDNFTYTFPASGTYTVWQRATGFGGQDSISYSVTVMKGTTFNYPIVSPAASADTVFVCGGDIISFQGDPAGVSYLWSTGETTSSISFPANSSLDISLTMTDANGFVWTSLCTPIYIEVFPSTIPVITNDDTVGYSCAGDLLTMYITNPVPGIYTWYVWNIATGWFYTGDHSLDYDYYADPSNGSGFYVTYTNAAGCNETSDTVWVQPHSLPFLNGVQLFATGTTLSYPTNGYTYQWYNYNLPIPGATSNFYTVTSTGCYSLKAWDAQYPDCESFTDTTCFEFTGINELENNFVIAPNPVNEFITINGLTPENEINELKIFNLLGEIVIREQYFNESTAITIDCSALQQGIYTLEISGPVNKFRKKILISGN